MSLHLMVWSNKGVFRVNTYDQPVGWLYEDQLLAALIILTYHSQEWSTSNLPFSLIRNITSHSMSECDFSCLNQISDFYPVLTTVTSLTYPLNLGVKVEVTDNHLLTGTYFANIHPSLSSKCFLFFPIKRMPSLSNASPPPPLISTPLTWGDYLRMMGRK